jgi:putative hemolysin
MGSEGDIESAYVTRSEIQDMLEAGQREGVLADEEHLMLQRLLRFRNRIVKETMVPRLDVVAVSTDADPSKAIEVCLESGFSQLPVYDGSLDNIVGTVDIMDLLANRESGATTSIRELASEPYVVPETKDVDELLIELRNDRQHIAIAVDEFGTTAGIVSVEDIVEEIIGEILTQTEEIPFRWLDDDTALVRGEVNVHMVNEALGTALPETNEFETIAGFMLDRAGRVVEEGETVTHDSVRLSAEITENNRILEVRVDLPADEENSAVRGTEESRDAESEDTERRGSSNKNAE